MKQALFIFSLISVAIFIVGAFSVSYQIYKMTVIDAKARELKHPHFWGLFAMNSNNLLLYLIGRRNYPFMDIDENKRCEIEARKKKVGVGVIYIVVGGIALAICVAFS